MSERAASRSTLDQTASRGRLRGPTPETWRTVRFVALTLLLAAGGSTALYLSTVLQQRAEGMTRYVRVDVWAVQQAEYELQQFRAIFARHVAGEPDATGAAVRAHLAHARSAVPLLRRGPDYHEFRLLADIDGAAEAANAALDEVARAFGDRAGFRGDLAMLRMVEDRLEEPARVLRQLAVDLAYVRLELQDGDLANVRWLSGVNHWIVTGSMIIAVLFIALLLGETRAARRAENRAREALREAQVANRSKTEFLTNMSHELRTPLNAIIGFSEISKMEMFGPLAAQYKSYAADIHDSARHLLDIINDILDISRIEAGGQKLQAAELEVKQVIEASLRLVRGRAESVGHGIAVEVPDDLPALHGDERAVKQILLNLLSNAIKFTPNGGRITVRAGLAAGGAMEIRIADTGIGIAARDMPKALSFFGQVDSRLERKYEGTGLGLPLARRLVELHGGELTLQSEVGQGTTVTLLFPAVRVVPGKSQHRAA